MNWAERIAARNAATAHAGRWREIREVAGGAPVTTLVGSGESVVSFASNDYLGLSQHPQVCAAAKLALDQYGAGAGSARLIVGARPIHRALEEELAEWKGTAAALILPTGYMANLAVLTALASDREVTVISDELNHASIIDAARLSRASVRVFAHRDMGALDEHLEASGPSIVVSDSVFSMDGDVADVETLVALAHTHEAFLVLDEAHAVLGPTCAEVSDEMALVGTLSKTLGSVGGFVAGSRALVDLLVNTARPFIFTTAPPPADSAAGLEALRILRGDEGARLTARLREHVELLAPGHRSPIVPVIVGAEHEALKASNDLLERGLLVPAIRPPTVAAGTCRLRIALSAAHTRSDVDRLACALAELGLSDRIDA